MNLLRHDLHALWVSLLAEMNYCEQKAALSIIHPEAEPESEEMRAGAAAHSELEAEAEKIGVLASRLATSERPADTYREVKHLGRLVTEMVREALDAYARMDATAAVSIARRDRLVDEEYEAIQRQVVDMFTDGRGVDWDPGEFDAFRDAVTGQGDTMLVSMRRLVDYTHHRTIQRLTLDRVDSGIVVADDPTAERAATEYTDLEPFA